MGPSGTESGTERSKAKERERRERVAHETGWRASARRGGLVARSFVRPVRPVVLWRQPRHRCRALPSQLSPRVPRARPDTEKSPIHARDVDELVLEARSLELVATRRRLESSGAVDRRRRGVKARHERVSPSYIEPFKTILSSSSLPSLFPVSLSLLLSLREFSQPEYYDEIMLAA